MMSADEMAAIRAREAAATPGPWEWDHLTGVHSDEGAIADVWSRHMWEDGPFIAHARTDIPALLAAHDALVGEIARLRAGIAELRKEHELVLGYCDYSEMCDGDEHCECGATKHNAAIAALLEGAP